MTLKVSDFPAFPTESVTRGSRGARPAVSRDLRLLLLSCVLVGSPRGATRGATRSVATDSRVAGCRLCVCARAYLSSSYTGTESICGAIPLAGYLGMGRPLPVDGLVGRVPRQNPGTEQKKRALVHVHSLSGHVGPCTFQIALLQTLACHVALLWQNDAVPCTGTTRMIPTVPAGPPGGGCPGSGHLASRRGRAFENRREAPQRVAEPCGPRGPGIRAAMSRSRWPDGCGPPMHTRQGAMAMQGPLAWASFSNCGM